MNKNEQSPTRTEDGDQAQKAPRKLQKPLRTDGTNRPEELATYSDEFAVFAT